MKIKSKLSPVLKFDSDELIDSKLDNYDFGKETKFDLYVHSRRIKQITAALDKIILTAQNQETLQMIRNRDFIRELMDELLDDSILVLDGIQLDDETIDLSMKLMEDIKRALAVLQQMTGSKQKECN